MQAKALLIKIFFVIFFILTKILEDTMHIKIEITLIPACAPCILETQGVVLCKLVFAPCALPIDNLLALCQYVKLVTDRVPDIGSSGTRTQPKFGFKAS